MGCDIHPFIDYDIKAHPRSGVAIRTHHFAKLDGARDYLLFGLLTNGAVRISDAEGYAPDPRGLPGMMGMETISEALMYVSKTRSHEESRDCTYEDAAKWTKDGSCRWVKVSWDKPLEYYDGSIHGALNSDGRPSGKGWRITHPDWHSYSWLTGDELEKVLEAYPKVGDKIWDEQQPGHITVSPEQLGWLWALRGLEEHDEVVQARLVFWFDC